MQGKVTIKIMTGLNAASGWINREPTDGSATKNTRLQNLIKESVSAEVSAHEPTGLNRYEKDTDAFNTRLRVLMKEKRDESRAGSTNTEEWTTGAITDREIDDVESVTIQHNVLKQTQRISALRSQLFYGLKSTYSHIRDQNDWESRLMGEIKLTDAVTMSNLIKNIRNRKVVGNFLRVIFGQNIAEWILNPEIRDLRDTLSDIDTMGLSVEDKKDIARIIKNRERFGQPPGSDDVRRILGYYRWATLERKKTLLISLGATLPLYSAMEYGFITDQDFDRIATRYFGNAYSWLDTAKKWEFRRSLSYRSSDDNIMVDFDELNGGSIDDIFTDPAKTKQVADDIFIKLTNEIPLKSRPEANILKKAAELWPDETDHQKLFNLYTEKTLKNQENAQSIQGIESLDKWSIIQFGEGQEISRFQIINNTDETWDFPYEVNDGLSLGVRIKELPVSNGYLRGWAESDLTYDALYGFFSQYANSAKVMNETDFRAQLWDTPDSISEGKIYDARNLDGDEITKANIIPKLDEIDTEWIKYGFGVGTYFTAPEEEKNGKAETRTWKVSAVGHDWVEIMSEGGSLTERVSMQEILALTQAHRLKRVNNVADESALLLGLRAYGIMHDAEIKHDVITQKNKDEDWKSIDEHIRVFSDGDRAHIRVDAIADGKVLFWEYVYEWEDYDVSGFAEKKWTKAAFQKFYQPQILTYWAFLEYLKKWKLKASTNDIIDVHAHDKHIHDHSHMEWSFLSRLGKMQNPASLWKGLEMIWHSLEHTLEKWAKLDAARFAMKFWKYLWDSVEAQLYADIVDGSKEIVEKIKNKIGNLPGPKWRKKCIHIAHNRDARPEEVMAAIQFMVSGYGHLYAEDTKHYQSTVTRANLASKPMGYFAYLDAFIHTTRMPWGIAVWRKKAYEKAKPELGSEGEPPEEMLLHALFKSIDGNPDEFPYAASVVKAIWWPGWFEKDWKFEGTKNAIQKGKDQTGMVNPQGRLNKAIGYLATHEIYKGIGAMEKVAGKVKEPHFQAFPFVWAVWGYSKHASHTALQDIKNYAQNGLSFHGYAFMQKEEDNMLYRDTVRLALAEMRDRGKVDQGAIDEFNGLCSSMDNGPEDSATSDKKYGKWNTAPKMMMLFWQKYQSKWLNEMLQWHDGWLTVASKKNATIESYRKHLIGQHSALLSWGTIPGTEYGKDWYEEHGIGMNLIMRESEITPWVRSLWSNLNKIKFGGTNRGGRPMNDDDRTKIWNYIVKNIKENRNVDRYYGDTELQKKEFLAWREEIITFFNKELSAWEVAEDAKIESLIKTKGYSYFQDLESIGIDPRAIFQPNIKNNANSESDYQAWRSGSIAGGSGSSSSGIIERVKGKTSWVQGRQNPSWRDPDDIGRRWVWAGEDWSV